MPRARNTDPQTSHDAAASVDDVTLTQAFVLRALKRPRTDPQLIEAYRKLKHAPRASESGIRTRRAELVDRGLVVDSGLRSVTPFGRKAIVWAASA
jgi:hypothetical protein